MTKLFWEAVFISIILMGCSFGYSSATVAGDTISAQGKLEQLEKAVKVKSPINGLVRKIYARDGDDVKKGDLLITIESTTSSAKSEIRSPIDGTVFELLATQGVLVSRNTSNALVQIVPSSNLIAKIYIPSRDVCFVEKGLPVDVRIDSFPATEFGDVKGTVVSINTQALPPDRMYPFYRFPVSVKLDRQTISMKPHSQTKEFQLRSGMSISANIQPRKRTSNSKCPKTHNTLSQKHNLMKATLLPIPLVSNLFAAFAMRI